MQSELNYVSRIVMNIMYKKYNDLTLIEISDLIKRTIATRNIDLSNYILTIKEVLSAFCWAPRYKTTEAFNRLYSSQFIGCDQSIIQFMYGRFLYDIIDKYIKNIDNDCIKYNIFNIDLMNLHFNKLFCYFLKNRDTWQKLIATSGSGKTNFHLRDEGSYANTSLHPNSMYSFFIPFLENLYHKLKSGERFEGVSLIIDDFDTHDNFELHEKIRIQINVSPNIQHYCVLSNNENKKLYPSTNINKKRKSSDEDEDNDEMSDSETSLPYIWKWISNTSISNQNVWFELDTLHNEIIENIKSNIYPKLLIAKMYYSIVSFCPLNRGSASLAEMFRTFYLQLFITNSNQYEMQDIITAIKLEYAQLDCIALSTPPFIFFQNYNSNEYFEILNLYEIFG